MADLFENPMGLCGFEFVEFASPVAGVLEPLFEKMGFSLVAKHRSKDVVAQFSKPINSVTRHTNHTQRQWRAQLTLCVC